MKLALENPAPDSAPPRRIETVVLPNEGDDGLFTQTWYPICLSEEIPDGGARSYPFLGGRVVAYRGEDGVARVMSGFCPHIGADLGDARVIGNGLQCPWHKFEFDQGGFCRKTGIGDPPPRSARLYAFPTEEKFGLIWAFNGDKPLFDIPGFPAEEDELVWIKESFPLDYGIEPWKLMGQLPDINHFATLHNMTLLDPQPWDTVEWKPFSMGYDINALRDGRSFKVHQEFWGTNILVIWGEFDGRWFGWLAPAMLCGPGSNRIFSITLAKRSGNAEDDQQFLRDVAAYNMEIGKEDTPLTQKMSFRVGTLTKSDRELFRYYHEYIMEYPRVVPAAGLLR